MATIADILKRINELRKSRAPTLFDELYVDLDLDEKHKAEDIQFPHAVKVMQSKAHTPGGYGAEQLRMIQYLNQRNAELHRDFIVRSGHQNGEWYKEYRFLDPNIAMMFKLAFAL